MIIKLIYLFTLKFINIYLMKALILCFLVSIFMSNLFAGDTVSLNLKMKYTKTIHKWEDLYIELKVKNIGQSPVFVTYHETWGMDRDTSGLFIVEVQKQQNGEYVNLQTYGTIDNLVYYDRFDTIKVSRYKLYTFHLGTTFRFKVGAFRVRVRSRLS